MANVTSLGCCHPAPFLPPVASPCVPFIPPWHNPLFTPYLPITKKHVIVCRATAAPLPCHRGNVAVPPRHRCHAGTATHRVLFCNGKEPYSNDLAHLTNEQKPLKYSCGSLCLLHTLPSCSCSVNFLYLQMTNTATKRRMGHFHPVKEQRRSWHTGANCHGDVAT